MLDLLKHRLLIWVVLERFKGFVIDWIDRLIGSAGLNIGLSVFTLLAWIAVKWYFGQSLFHSSRSASALNDAACWAHFDETSPTTDKKTSATIPIAVRELISIQSRIGFFCQHSTASFWSFLKLHIFDQARFFRPLATQWFLMLSYFYLTSYLTNDMNWLELRLQLNWIIHIQTHAAKLFLSVFKKYKYIKYALYKPKLLSYILCRNGTYSVDTTVLPSTFTSMSEYTITSCGVFSVFFAW